MNGATGATARVTARVTAVHTGATGAADVTAAANRMTHPTRSTR